MQVQAMQVQAMQVQAMQAQAMQAQEIQRVRVLKILSQTLKDQKQSQRVLAATTKHQSDLVVATRFSPSRIWNPENRGQRLHQHQALKPVVVVQVQTHVAQKKSTHERQYLL
jgi:hypothetical protein